MSSELSLLVELNNPLYLFPIIGVVFTALMVYAFGFKSSSQPPNEVFDVLNDRNHKNYKTQENVKKKKQNKTTSGKSESKSEPNGHINSGSVKTTEEKTPKKSVAKPKPDIPTPVTNNVKSTKTKKNKKNEELVDREDIDDKDSGEWVELISKKEKKNRKQKEEQLLTESQKSPKKDKYLEKSPKKVKENKSKPKLETKTENAVQIENKKNDLLTKNEKNVINEEMVAEEPNIYELAKEQRVPKKSQKQQRNQKQRNSESENTPKVDESVVTEPKANLDLKDKLTAAIVANYEANDVDKTDASSNANNKKKKEKNKKKQTQSVAQTQPTLQTLTEDKTEDNNKKIVRNDNKINSISVIESETEVQKSDNSVNTNDIPNDMKPNDDEGFKSVTKKRRPRRE